MPTRRRLLATLAALPLMAAQARAGGLMADPAPLPASARTHAVEIRGFAYSPAALVIAPGDTVVFTNRDAAPHTVTAEDGGFDSGRIGTGQSVRMVFPARGEHPYFCAIHPRMRGGVSVR